MANCCNKCGTKGKCGCNDSVLHLPPSCPDPTCPNPEPCAETWSDCCVIHNGDSYTYFQDKIVEPGFTVLQGERMCDTLQRLVAYLETKCTTAIVGMKSNTITSSTINVSWTPFTGTSYYEVYISEVVPSPSFTTAGSVIANTSPNFTITGLTPNTSYYVNVMAFDSSENPISCLSVSLILTTKSS